MDICSSETSISSLHSFYLFLFLSNFLSLFLIFSTAIQIFFFSVFLRPFLSCQIVSQLATLMKIFDKVWRCLGTSNNTNFHSCDIAKANRYMKASCMAPFHQDQCFQVFSLFMFSFLGLL